jgi:hypothetical protein
MSLWAEIMSAGQSTVEYYASTLMSIAIMAVLLQLLSVMSRIMSQLSNIYKEIQTLNVNEKIEACDARVMSAMSGNLHKFFACETRVMSAMKASCMSIESAIYNANVSEKMVSCEERLMRSYMRAHETCRWIDMRLGCC